MSDYEVNEMVVVKVVTKEQGIFFSLIHDGFRLNAIPIWIKNICGMERLEWEHIEIIHADSPLLEGLIYGEVWCGTGDVLIRYRDGKVVGVDRVSD